MQYLLNRKTFCVKNVNRQSLCVKNVIMTGADILIKKLEYNGVKHIFGLPGGACIPLCTSIQKSKIKYILNRHEQASAFAAAGYSKSSNKIGVFVVTSGPGIINAINGIVDAMIDSVPLICISGQVATNLQGLNSFQEIAIADMVNDYCKYVFKVTHVSQIPRIIDEAFYITKHGRPGPVLIDIPKDIQNETYDFQFEPILNLCKFTRNERKIISPNTIDKFINMLIIAKKPVFYIGGGCLNASKELNKLLSFIKIPVVSTLMGLGIVSSNNKLSLNLLGMHGNLQANFAVYECDLLIAIGVRFDDRVTSKIETFAKNAKIIHIDIDSKEIGKNKEVDMAICSDSKIFITMLINYLKESPHCREMTYKYEKWYEYIIESTKNKQKKYEQGQISETLSGQQTVKTLNHMCKKLDIEPIICTDVGAGQMFICQHFNFNQPKQLLTSGGLGCMGCSIGYAIGAYFANKDKIIISTNGDGGILMNIQELATIGSMNIPIKIIIINNQILGMVQYWDPCIDIDKSYTFLGNKNNHNEIYPDFIKISNGFGIKAKQVYNIFDLENAIIEMLSFDGPYLLDVIVKETSVVPFIPPNSSYIDTIID